MFYFRVGSQGADIRRWFVVISVEVISKPRLRPDGSVAGLLKMLTYVRVCCAFSSARALPSNLIQGFETASKIINEPDRYQIQMWVSNRIFIALMFKRKYLYKLFNYITYDIIK